VRYRPVIVATLEIFLLSFGEVLLAVVEQSNADCCCKDKALILSSKEAASTRVGREGTEARGKNGDSMGEERRRPRGGIIVAAVADTGKNWRVGTP
jgi:hypothetical protein